MHIGVGFAAFLVQGARFVESPLQHADVASSFLDVNTELRLVAVDIVVAIVGQNSALAFYAIRMEAVAISRATTKVAFNALVSHRIDFESRIAIARAALAV